MPTPEGRALSIQAQYALELLADQVGSAAAYLLASAADFQPETVKGLARQYEALIVGAVGAVAALRAGYMQAFATSSGEAAFTIPASVVRPDLTKVLVGGQSPAGAVYSAVASLQKWVDEQAQAADTAAQSVLDRVAQQRPPQEMATALLRDYADSTIVAASDFVDNEILMPSRRVVALRRVAHPTACPRCVAVSGVLVYVERPTLRHPQCRCSTEPVFLGDPEYAGRLSRYGANAGFSQSGRFASDVRRRGRAQQADARFRESSEWMQAEWREYLAEEQTRLSKMVTTVRSDTYRRWAVMTSANIAEIGGDLLPVITRN